MIKPYRFLVGLVATVFSLFSMIIGIMLVNAIALTFWQMIWYDLLFVIQFLTFLWCAILYGRRQNCDEVE